MSKKVYECTSLSELRLEIDRIDKEIISLLGERFLYVKEVVKYRDPEQREVADKERYNLVIKERGKWAREKGLNAEAIENVYRHLLDYYISEQKLVAESRK